MDYKTMTPAQVWQDYDAETEALDTLVNDEYKENQHLYKAYTITAKTVDDGKVRVGVRVTHNVKSRRKKAVLIVQEYHKKIQKKVVKDLADKGYKVVVPDCTGGDIAYKTSFPPSLNYGNITEAESHIKEVSPTAKDTSQYLYSVIVKRTITFIKKELGIEDIIIMGIGDATEVAMQVAGSDNRLKGLVCINGAGYREYIHINKYGDKKELEIDHKLMCWLTGVAAVAYAKHIEVPIMIALSSNGRQADIDRLSNLMVLLKENQASLMITPRSSDSISYQAYKSVLGWIEDIFTKKRIPKNPVTQIRVSDGLIYADVAADAIREIKEVKVYYSYGEYDHLVRNWHEKVCDTVSSDQFLAKLEVTKTQGPLFAFCIVEYKDGSALGSIEDYEELKDLDIKKTIDLNSRIIYEGAMGTGSFTEEADKAILLKSGLMTASTPLGLKGVMSNYGELINYQIGAKAPFNKGKILQVDAYCHEDIDLEIKVVAKNGDDIDEYTATCPMTTGDGAFVSHKLTPNDFKNSDMMSFDDWDKVKAIKIKNKNVIIGKILFI
ncbi:MAG: hypothetical protein ACOCWI_03980 [Bacillota bacterium]